MCQQESKASGPIVSKLGAGAPEFVPLAMQGQQSTALAEDLKLKKPQKGGKKAMSQGGGLRADAKSFTAGAQSGLASGFQAKYGDAVTTVMASGIAPDHTQESFSKLMDAWGLTGTYDFLFLPVDPQSRVNAGYVFINFIDPAFVLLLCCIYQECQIQGTVTPSEIQGLEANRKHWAQCCKPSVTHFKVTAEVGVGGLGFRPAGLPPSRVLIQMIEEGSWAERKGVIAGDELISVKGKPVAEMAEGELSGLKHERPLTLEFVREEFVMEVEPVIMLNAVPTQWAVNTVNAMLAPQLNEQCRKTKLCIFNAQHRCEMGSTCPFAHSQAELQPTPDLAKTKLCHNFFRRRCTDQRCRFAHGSRELRSEWVPYTPGVTYFDGFSGWGEDMHGMPSAALLGSMQGPQAMMGHMQGAETMMGYSGVEAYPAGIWSQVPNAGGSLLAAQEAPSSEDEEEEGEAEAATSASGPAAAAPKPPGPESVRRTRSVTSDLPGDGERVMLREWGTFMEAVELRDLEPEDRSRRRSWSDSDLPAFREAMEVTEPG